MYVKSDLQLFIFWEWLDKEWCSYGGVFALESSANSWNLQCMWLSYCVLNISC